MKKSCTFTGPKPTRFKFGYNENYTLCKKIKKALMLQIKRLYNEKGVRQFYVAGVMGVHMWTGELVLQLKEQAGYEDIELNVVLPFPGYDAQWDIRSQKRMEHLIHSSIETITVSQQPGQGGYLDCNRYLIEHSDFLIAVSENAGAELSALTKMEAYAYKKQRQIIFIHPDTAATSGFPEKK